MKTATLALGGALLLSCLAPAADPSKPASAPAGDVQDFVFLGESRPVLVRLHVRAGGKSLEAAWSECLDYLFGYLDVNKDGVLTKDEAERAPAVDQLTGGNLGRFRAGGARGGGGMPPAGPSMEALDADRDGKVTRAELAAWYRKNGFTPFQFRFDTRQANPIGAAAAIFGGPRPEPSVEAVSKAIFNLLDTDKDGKLSKAELEAAPAVLLRLDEDDDEVLTPQELVPDSGSPLGGIAGMIAMGRPDNREQPTSSPKLVPVRAPGEVPADLARRMLDRYARGDAKKLGRKELGLDEATFRRLDVNGDGLLDSEELGAFVKLTPDLELVMRLGKRGSSEAPLEVVSGKGRSPLAGKVALRDGLALLDLGATRVELRGNDQDRPDRIAGFLRQQTLGQFRQADSNRDGVLDSDEIQRSRTFRGLAKMVDRNGDGKIDEKELNAYLDHLQTLQQWATAGCVTLEVSDQSRGLFDLLDLNRDGRLSLREMRRAPQLVAGREYLTREDIPRTYRLEVRRGPANAGGLGDVGAVVERYLGSSGRAEPEPTGIGPRWFRTMDRNRDGDVSRREFLFGEELFRRLDIDGDGLISVEEAEKAGALGIPEDKKDR